VDKLHRSSKLLHKSQLRTRGSQRRKKVSIAILQIPELVTPTSPPSPRIHPSSSHIIASSTPLVEPHFASHYYSTPAVSLADNGSSIALYISATSPIDHVAFHANPIAPSVVDPILIMSEHPPKTPPPTSSPRAVQGVRRNTSLALTMVEKTMAHAN
jgi:hypothetical protein